MTHEPPVVLAVPCVPQAGGNGLAMRAGMLLEALATTFDVDLVVVPISGPVADTGWAAGLARSLAVVEPVGDAAAQAHVIRQLADAALRERLVRTTPQPWRALAVPPTLAVEAAGLLGLESRRARALVALRGYLAPFACMLARALEARRLVIDVDEDEERLARSLGVDDEADAIGRLARAWLPDADVVCAAAAREAGDIAIRYGLQHVATLPNAVRIPPPTAPPPGAGSLLFVGNLTYEPNREAAELLAREILPLVRERHPGATATIVGPHEDALAAAAHVAFEGAVPDLRPYYEAADAVVAPLLHGAGTRIKILEAFAYRRPVVATSVAVAGLGVRDGDEALIADSPRELARAIGALLEDASRGQELVESAARLVAARYSQQVVGAQVRELVAG